MSAAQLEARGEVHQGPRGGRRVMRQACLAVALCMAQQVVDRALADEGLGLQGHDGAAQGDCEVAEIALDGCRGVLVAGGAHEEHQGLLGGRGTGGVEALPAQIGPLQADAPLGVGEAEQAGDEGRKDLHDKLTIAAVVLFLQLATWWLTTLRWERLYNEAVRWAQFEHEQYMEQLRKTWKRGGGQ